MRMLNARSNNEGDAVVDVSGMTRRRFCALLAAAGAVLVVEGAGGTMKAFAADGSEVADITGVNASAEELNGGLDGAAEDAMLLSMFFVDHVNSDGTTNAGDWHNVLCTSQNGTFFEIIGEPYHEFAQKDVPFHDPGLFYKDGMFWTLASEQRDDQRFWPVLGLSKDLQTWTAPESRFLINGGTWEGVAYDPVPFGLSDVDNVAPDAFVDDDGTAYMVVSAGYYGAFHGDPENDRMRPYLVKFKTLSCDGPGSNKNEIGHPYPANMRLEADGPAREIHLPIASDNRIDGSLSKEDGVYYLSIKRDGVNNEVYRNAKLDVDGWELCADGISIGTEGPSLVKFKGAWGLYTDRIATWQGTGETGIRVSQAQNANGPWPDPQPVVAVDIDRNPQHIRHGAVVVVSDSAALEVVKAARSAAGWDMEGAPKAWFSDVSRNDWGYESIYWCADRGLLSGYAGTTLFGTYDGLTRAQAAVVLWRYLNPAAASDPQNDAAPNKTPFTDVEDRSWYMAAVNWAVENEVMSGYSGTTHFGPYDQMTREQLFAIVANAASVFCGADIASPDESKMNALPDAASVSDWAREVVAWGLNEGVMSGVLEDGVRYLRPQKPIDRSTMAAVMMNAIQSGVLFVK